MSPPIAGAPGSPAVPDWTFLLAFSFFRIAAIVQGVYKRSLDGNASNPERARKMGEAVPLMARLAMEDRRARLAWAYRRLSQRLWRNPTASITKGPRAGLGRSALVLLVDVDVDGGQQHDALDDLLPVDAEADRSTCRCSSRP